MSTTAQPAKTRHAASPRETVSLRENHERREAITDMKFLSVCSGIEAASVAWKPLGWQAVGFSEIEPFPCAVLAHHYPDVPNFGDLTKWREWDVPEFDVLAGGTPCQGFSVAGRRGGLQDPRSQLAFDFLGIAGRYQPRWIVWENVPGVLSSDGGRDFGAFLGELGKLGYGFAYRVLDAQYFGLAQRRKRVFVVGYLGDWRPAAAVLLEPESLRGDSPPSRETGQGVAADTAGSLTGSGRGVERTGESRGQDPVVAQCHGSSVGPMGTLRGGNGNETGGVPFTIHGTDKTQRVASETDIAGSIRTKPPGSQENSSTTVIAAPLSAGSNPNSSAAGRRREDDENLVAHTLKAEGRDASEDGTGRGVPLTVGAMVHQDHGGVDTQSALQGYIVPTVFDPNQVTSKANRSTPTPDLSHTLPGVGNAPVVFNLRGREGGSMPEEADVASLRSASGGSSRSYVAQMAVRRLTPTECARLQGFPDDYLDITYRGKPAADGPKYKALGNSWAVPCARWIGARIGNSVPPQVVEPLVRANVGGAA